MVQNQNKRVSSATNRAGWDLASLLLAGVAAVAAGGGTPAYASLTIVPTFDPSISATPTAVTAIDAAITSVETNISSPNNITVPIYFTKGSGLGTSLTGFTSQSYFNYYNAYKAVATQPNQITALNSLGAAPGPTTGNPVNGTAMIITTAEGRNLGFNTPGTVTVAGVTGTFDSEVFLNTSITFPPQPNSGSTFGLQSTATHEIDEVLGIGGAGSQIGGTGFFATGVGDTDLYRYSAPGVRSFSTVQTTNPFSYFSINGGTTVLSYFNQTNTPTTMADYGDWLSNPIPAGFSPQVQDAFGQPGTDPALGPNEITAFNAIGYDVAVVPAPKIGFGLPTFLAVSGFLFGARLLQRRRSNTAGGAEPA